MSKMIQIRDVPEDLHRTLKARAATRGMSLSDYLKGILAREATRLTWRATPRSSNWHSLYHPSSAANINGATIVASDSMTNIGVVMSSLPQVIFSVGTAPEYEP